jgi:hypothetical protein
MIRVKIVRHLAGPSLPREQRSVSLLLAPLQMRRRKGQEGTEEERWGKHVGPGCGSGGPVGCTKVGPCVVQDLGRVRALLGVWAFFFFAG